MVDGLPRHGPLAHRVLGVHVEIGTEPGVKLGEPRERACISLRGAPMPELRHIVAEHAGCGLPLNPHEATAHGGMAALWLGPDEWLITGDADGAALATALQNALHGLFVSTTDLSHAWRVIHLAGPNSRDVLAKGCSLDLHPRAFQPAHTTRTVLAQAAVILHQTGDDAYDIFVRRSYADYLWQWLADAGKEFGVAVL